MHEATGYCDSCDRKVMVRSKGANHILHFLLALFTAGLWIPVWILVSLARDWRCTACGTRTRKKHFN